MTIIERPAEPYEKRCGICACLFRFGNIDIRTSTVWSGDDYGCVEIVRCPICHRELNVDRKLDIKYDFGGDD